MAASFNKVILLGNLTRDPVRRYTPKGTAVTEFAIAINENYKTDSGESREQVHYIDIYTFGRQAENCAQYLTKGSPVLIDGRLQQDRWETEKKEKRSRVRVFAERVQFIGKAPARSGSGQDFREESAGAPAAPAGYETPAAPPARPQSTEQPPSEYPDEPPAGMKEKDDIPF